MKSSAHVRSSTGGAVSGCRTRRGTRRDGRVLECQIRVHPLQLGVLGLELPQPCHIGDTGPTVFAAPLEKGGSTDAVRPQEVVDGHAGLGVFQDVNNLGLAEL